VAFNLSAHMSEYLAQYVAMFEWAHNLKRVTDHFLRTLMKPGFIFLPT
jgi:formate hydrogenlyase subunit 4